ncbi:MAG: LpqB family beta-propeller domain-containing protein [Streptosporangiaceae bacterium]
MARIRPGTGRLPGTRPAARRRLRPAAAAALAAAAGLAAAGCATVPASGPVKQAGTSGQLEQYPQLLAVPPRPGWSASDVVTGFLHASASGFDGNHAIARDYLTPQLRRKWNPGWAVTVVGSQLESSVVPPLVHIVGAPSRQVAQVTITGQRLASLSDSGQLTQSSGSTVYHFSLVRTGGRWLISRLQSATLLLLTKPDFTNVYQPHDLYFTTPSSQVLVPDPVFVPQAESAADVAKVLVRALMTEPGGWLQGAATTAFPRGTTLLQPPRFNGTSVIVNLGGAAAKASSGTLERMAAQLAWTLAAPSYSAPAIAQSVVLQVNGVRRRLYGQGSQSRGAYESWLRGWKPPRSTGQLYFLNDYAVSALSGGRARPVPGAARLSHYRFTAIAVRPGGHELAGLVPGRTSGTIYTAADSGRGRVLARRITGGTPMSLSFDHFGDLWVAAGRRVWMLPSGDGDPVPVSTGLPASDTVTGLRVAPDGVRVAMIIQAPGGTAQIAIGAVTGGGSSGPGGQPSIGPRVTVGSNISDPSQLAWYGSDDILVLARPGARSALYEAPVNGGQASQIIPVPDISSLSSDGQELAVATADHILTSSGPNATWKQVASGSQPAFPG